MIKLDGYKLNLHDLGVVIPTCPLCNNDSLQHECDSEDIKSHHPNTFEVYLYCIECQKQVKKVFSIEEY